MSLDTAIPAHLQCPRHRAKRLREGFVPAYPSFVARFAERQQRVVMAYLGLQHAKTRQPPSVEPRLDELSRAFKSQDGPSHWDRAAFNDHQGFRNILTAAYWRDTAAFGRWWQSQGVAWKDAAAAGGDVGVYLEVLQPSAERYETLFSDAARHEGVAVLSEGMSGPVAEHAYWGGARDRIALSQTDDLAPRGQATVVADGAHRRVQPHDNLCLIRSGQDWTDTAGEERRMYLKDVEPVLRAGMEFLANQGNEVGCLSNRYVRVLDSNGHETDKSYGMSYWRSLGDLERWAESHPTHVAIFGAAMQYLSHLGPAAQLRLYHEVSVLDAASQRYEYWNCHPRTGVLGGLG